MKAHFWGTRGSLPASIKGETIRRKIFRALEAARGVDLSSADAINAFMENSLPFSVKNTYGINTSCVEIMLPSEEYVICDAGSGIRDFSDNFMKENRENPSGTFHIFISHLHWDHIQGFPFFAPAYIPGNDIIIHGYHDQIPRVFKSQMEAPCFPVSFDQLGARIEFDIQSPDESFNLGDLGITAMEQNHPGKSYGYRFAREGKNIVYSTDSEHKEEAYQSDYGFIGFFAEADLLIFDAMYTLADATFNKADWGHSSNVMGVEIASRAKVKHLCMFHNEPTAKDSELDEFLFNTRMYSDIYHSEQVDADEEARYPREISLAYDGLEIEV